MLPAMRRRHRVGVFVAGVVVLAAVGSITVASPVRGAPEDPRDELLVRLERGVTTTWAMTTKFHRDTPAGPLDAKLEQLNRQPDWLSAGFGSVRGVWKGQTVDCANAPGGPLCGPAATVDPTISARTSVKALRNATGRGGTARVRRDGSTRAAGRRGHCYSVLPRRDRTARRTVTQYCLTRNGIPLRVRVRRADSSDTATAQTVRTEVTDADFERLLTGYPIGPPP